MQHFRRLLSCALLVGSALCGTLAHGQEWTRFRGPNGSGISDAETIPAEWTKKDYNWNVELPAAGHSSPVLWGDKIFLLRADDDESGRQTFFCLDAADGKVLWTRNYESHIYKKHKLNSFAAATSAVDAERVYITWSVPERCTLAALDHDGKDVWSRDLGPFITIQGDGSSPILFEDMVIFSADQEDKGEGKSFILAVDKKTGEDRWRLERKTGTMAYSTPCIRELKDGPVELISNSTQHGIFGIDPHNGRPLWEVNNLFDKRSCSSPVIIPGGDGDDLILGSCGSGGGGNYLVAAHPGSASQPESGRLAYKIDKQAPAPYVPTPIVKNGLLFLLSDKGLASCLRPLTGEVVWKQKRLGGDFYGSPICVGDKLYAVSADGEVVVWAASEDYQLLGKHALEEVCRSTPAVAGGRLYIRTYKHLLSLGGDKQARGDKRTSRVGTPRTNPARANAARTKSPRSKR